MKFQTFVMLAVIVLLAGQVLGQWDLLPYVNKAATWLSEVTQ